MGTLVHGFAPSELQPAAAAVEVVRSSCAATEKESPAPAVPAQRPEQQQRF